MKPQNPQCDDANGRSTCSGQGSLQRCCSSGQPELEAQHGWSTPIWQEGVLSGHVHMCTAAYHWCWWRAGRFLWSAGVDGVLDRWATSQQQQQLLCPCLHELQMRVPIDSRFMADSHAGRHCSRTCLQCPISHGRVVSLQALELAHVDPEPQPTEAVCNGIRLPSTTVRRGSTAAAGPTAAGRTGGSRAASRSEAPGDNEAESPPEVRWGKEHVYGCQHQSGDKFMNINQVICTVDNKLTAY